MRTLAALTLLALLAACGQTGPLYLPGEAPREGEAASVPAPASPTGEAPEPATEPVPDAD